MRITITRPLDVQAATAEGVVTTRHEPGTVLDVPEGTAHMYMASGHATAAPDEPVKAATPRRSKKG